MAAAYRLADARVGVSAGVCRDMAQLSWMRVGRFSTIYNPVRAPNGPTSEASTLADQSWLDRPGSRILSVGRFKPVKNHKLLLRAFANLASSAQLMMLGNGQDEAALKALAKDLGIADRVIFPGFHADPTPFYQTADLFVLSSNYEGFGNVIVEALACGTPVVSTDCRSGPREILKEGAYGTLVAVNDERALATAMREALNTKHDPERLKARARDFNVSLIADQYLKLLT